MTSEARTIMRELGFSETECMIYFSLLDTPEGESIDNVLAQAKGQSERVESAIKNLVEKGLVRLVSNKLEASEPKQFISRIQDSKRMELTRNLESLNARTSRLLSVLDPQYWETRLGIKPEDLLEPLASLEEMEVRTVRIVANANTLVSISAETFSWFSKVREELYRAVERGVKFRVLMMVKDKEASQRATEAKGLGIEIRQPTEDWYPVRGTLGDEKELVFLIWATREKAVQKAKFFRPHYSKNPGMIRVFADAFEKRWDAARPV